MNKSIKKSIALLVAGLTLSFNMQAHEKENSKNEVLNINDIKNHLTFPTFIQATNHTEVIKVVFTVNDNGNINLVIANTTNAVIKQSIETQFMKLTFNHLKTNHTYGIQFNFKTI